MLHRALKLYFEPGDRAANAGAAAAGLPPAGSDGTKGQDVARAIVDAQDAAAQNEAAQKGNAALDQEISDFAYRHRLSQQAALIIFAKQIIDDLEKRAAAIAETGTSAQIPRTEDPEIAASGLEEPLLASVANNAPVITEDLFRRKLQYKNFSTARIGNGRGDAGHFGITGRLTKDPAMNIFFNRLPAQILSLLVPKIELYKIFYPKTNSFSSGIPWRIPFDDVPVKYEGSTSQFVSRTLEELLAGTSKGHGVGIKSFNYSFKGTNYAEIKNSIYCELDLYFQTPEDIIGPNGKPIDVAIPQRNINDKFSYADLYNQVSRYRTDIKNRNADLIPNDKYYRIKAVVGYAPIDNNALTQAVINAKIPEIVNNKMSVKDYVNFILKGVEKSKVILFLSPYSHDIEFNEDGSCNLKIRFNSATEISLYSKQADIFKITSKSQEYSKKEAILNDFLLVYKNEKIKPDEQPVDDCNTSQNTLKRIQEAKKYFQENGITDFTEDNLKQQQLEVFESRRDLYNSLYKVLIGEDGLTGRKNGIFSVKLDSWIVGVDQFGVGADIKDKVASERVQAIKNYNGNPIIEIKKISFKDDATLAGTRATITSQIEATKDKIPTGAEEAAEASKSNNNENNKIATELLENGKYAVNVKFIFLGDILDAAFECLNAIQPVSEQQRIIIGEIPIVVPTAISAAIGVPNETREIYVNLADIPISIDLFHKFLIDRIVDKQLTTYSVFSFLQDIIGLLIRPAIDPKIFGIEGAANNSIRFSVANLALPCNTYTKDKSYTDPVFKKEINNNNFNPIINDGMIQVLKNPINDVTVVSSPIINYMFIYCSSAFPKFFNGDEAKDIKNGVFHFRIGTDTGIVKTIKFSRSDVPYQREYLAAQEGAQKGTTLKQVYNSTITLFGNNLYYIGDYIFIEPYFFGTRERTATVGNKLGLGGYYQIIKVNSTFTDGDYSTVLECTYQAGVETKDGKKIVTPANSPCRS